MDSNYFGFIDSSTNRFHWFKYDSNYKTINTTTPLTLLLTSTPLRIDFPSSSLFILTQPPASTGSSDLWLTQYDLSLEQLRVFSVPKNFLDLEVMQNYLILTTNDKIAFQHTAIFPEKLAQDHILSWSNEGDIVFDPMSGSGTTCKMAKLNNRNYLGMEISKEYTDLSIKRLEMMPLQLF